MVIGRLFAGCCIAANKMSWDRFLGTPTNYNRRHGHTKPTLRPWCKATPIKKTGVAKNVF